MPNHGIPHELTIRLRGGETEALGELFSLCQERLRRLVHFRLDPRLVRRVDVDDVLQDAYLDAETRLPHFATTDDGASPYVWLRMVTVQTLQDTHRRHLGTKARDASREQRMPDTSTHQTSLNSMAQLLVGQLTSPSQAVQRAEAVEQINAALEKMNPMDQEILALRNFEELSNTEVAEVLGIENGTASNRYIRALKRLQQVMVQFPESGRSW
ncbi:MAG: sigma-70 family RNA polymerase sigma factor [Planctomycetota bacterium]